MNPTAVVPASPLESLTHNVPFILLGTLLFVLIMILASMFWREDGHRPR